MLGGLVGYPGRNSSATLLGLAEDKSSKSAITEIYSVILLHTLNGGPKLLIRFSVVCVLKQ